MARAIAARYLIATPRRAAGEFSGREGHLLACSRAGRRVRPQVVWNPTDRRRYGVFLGGAGIVRGRLYG